MSPPGRPEGEYRRAPREGAAANRPGRSEPEAPPVARQSWERPAPPRPGRRRFVPQRLQRHLALAALRRGLEAHSFPRLQMALIVALTGLGGGLASFGLLHAGVDSMALRYPLALGLAYGLFLLLLWLWLRTRAEDYTDLPDPSVLLPDATPGPAPWGSGGGGDFGGGGASASFDDLQPAAVLDAEPGQALGRAVGAAAEGEELAIPLLALLLAAGMALASLWLVYLAPVLFAELLLDGALAFGLYRHLRHDGDHWLGTAVRRTVWPFVLTALFLALVGLGLQQAAPGARTLGEVRAAITAGR